MTYETLKTEREGPLMTVRLNRPERRNAINRQMHLDLQEVCRELSEDFETRVVIWPGRAPPSPPALTPASGASPDRTTSWSCGISPASAVAPRRRWSRWTR